MLSSLKFVYIILWVMLWTLFIFSLFSVNNAIINNNFIFYDAPKDTQSGASYHSDLKEFKIKSSTSGLEFEIRFSSLSLLNNRILPLIQIGIDWSDTGVPLFVDQNAVGNFSQNPYSKIKFDRVIYAYDTDTTTLKEQNTVGIAKPNQTNDGWTISFPANLNSIYEYNISSKTVNIFAPFSLIGGSDKYRTKWVKFSVAIFVSSAAITGNDTIDIYKISNNKPNITDCISSFSTDEELSDGEVSFYFKVKFDENLNISSSTLKIKDSKLNIEGINKNIILYSDNLKPLVTFNFETDDEENLPLLYYIEIGKDKNFTNKTVLLSFFEEEIIFDEETNEGVARTHLNTTFKGNTTYYIRARIIDSQGIWTSTTTQTLFFVKTSSITFEENKSWIKVVYNNPLKIGNKSIIAYYVNDFDRNVNVRVYSITGRFIKTLVDNELKREKAIYQVEWDSKDEGGNYVMPGIYYILFEYDNERKGITKIVVVK